MKKLLFNLFQLFIVMSAYAQAESKYPIDFDEDYFRKSPFSRFMRDPFKNPPGYAKSNLEKSKWPKLEKVVVVDEIPVIAVLDGKKFREGQFIDEERYISSIGQNFVIITEGSFDYELVVPDPKRSLAGEKSEGEK